MRPWDRCRSRPPRHGCRAGFTLIELLVVIGIIAVLVGLLFPAIAGVRKHARQAETQQEMSRLGSAINAYYTDFRAYPGPLSEDQVAPGASGVTGFASITSSENLFLGLEGGLQMNGAAIAYMEPSTGATGPYSLNPAAPGKHAAYYNYSPAETSYTSSSDAARGTTNNGGNAMAFPIPGASDSAVPEFMDHFSLSMPILYLRARVGASGVVNPIGTTPATPVQYDERQLQPYGWTGPNGTVNTTDFPKGTNPDSDTTYFSNPALTGVPKGKDGFILISAGIDGQYGTKDDIFFTN